MIADREFPVGDNKVLWDAKDQSSGVYFVTIKSVNSQSVGKLLLLK
jgi:hypothetical protein